MPTRTAEAEWQGSLRDGKGEFAGSGAFSGSYSFGTRFEDSPGTNPEELIAAAHAACYSMALSGELGNGGATVGSVRTTAGVTVEKQEVGFAITGIHLATEVRATGIDEEEFQRRVAIAKDGCPVSKALSAVAEITVDARLA